MTVTVSSEAMVENPQEGYKGTRPKPKALTGVGPSSPRGWDPLGPHVSSGLAVGSTGGVNPAVGRQM